MRKLIKSFTFAFSGLRYAFGTQSNFRIHSGALLLVCAAGWYFSLSGIEWLFVAAASGLVVITELLNTAVQVLVDLVSPGIIRKRRSSRTCLPELLR